MALEVNGKFEQLATPSEDNENYDRIHRIENEKGINDIVQKSENTLGCIFRG
jgi:hypothetical protein